MALLLKCMGIAHGYLLNKRYQNFACLVDGLTSAEIDSAVDCLVMHHLAKGLCVDCTAPNHPYPSKALLHSLAARFLISTQGHTLRLYC